MGTLAKGSVWLGAGALVAMTIAAPQPASAFFDELARAIFSGGGPAPVVRYVERPSYYAPEEQPRSRPRPVEHVSSKPAPPAVKLDPEAAPHWYLKDPPLRKGDIVVTAQGPVVFQGRAGEQHRPSAFVSLDESRSLSRAERRIVAAATDSRWR